MLVTYKPLACSSIWLLPPVSERRLKYELNVGYQCKCMTTVPARPPGERSPAAVSSSLSDEVMCYGVGTTELVYGMHDPTGVWTRSGA